MESSGASQVSPAVTVIQPAETMAQAAVRLETEKLPRTEKKRRRKNVREKIRRANAEHTVLQQASVSTACRTRYKKHWRDTKSMVLTGRGRLRSLPAVDAALAVHLEELYRDGEDLSTARYAIAATLFFRPELRSRSPGMSNLPKMKQSLAGCAKLCAPRSRLPIPYPVMCMLAVRALNLKAYAIGICMLFTFALYLRPSERLRLRKMDLVKPSPRQAGFQHWSVVLHPAEMGVSSKTQEYDECLLLDLPYHQPLGEAAFKLLHLQRLKASDLIFSISLEDVSQFLEQARKELGLTALGVTPTGCGMAGRVTTSLASVSDASKRRQKAPRHSCWPALKAGLPHLPVDLQKHLQKERGGLC